MSARAKLLSREYRRIRGERKREVKGAVSPSIDNFKCAWSFLSWPPWRSTCGWGTTHPYLALQFEADALYYKTLEVLDRETSYGRRGGGS